MNPQVVSKTKLVLDGDFNIIDPNVEVKKAGAIAKINIEIEQLKN